MAFDVRFQPITLFKGNNPIDFGDFQTEALVKFPGLVVNYILGFVIQVGNAFLKLV